MTSTDTEASQVGYEKLEVFRRGMALLGVVEQIVRLLPDHEKYDLVQQMRRAAKSVPANIAEGYARRSQPREFARFLRISLGSSNEMEVHLKIARQMGYVAPEKCATAIDEYGLKANS